MHAMSFERPDEALDHAVLLQALRRDELLFQPVATDDGGEVVAGEDESIVRAQQELLLDAAHGAKPGGQHLLQGGTGGRGFAGFRQVRPKANIRVFRLEIIRNLANVWGEPSGNSLRFSWAQEPARLDRSKELILGRKRG